MKLGVFHRPIMGYTFYALSVCTTIIDDLIYKQKEHVFNCVNLITCLCELEAAILTWEVHVFSECVCNSWGNFTLFTESRISPRTYNGTSAGFHLGGANLDVGVTFSEIRGRVWLILFREHSMYVLLTARSNRETI